MNNFALLGKLTVYGLFVLFFQIMMSLIFWIPFSLFNNILTSIIGILGTAYVIGYIVLMATKGVWKKEMREWRLL